MTAELLSGGPVADSVLEDVKSRTRSLIEKGIDLEKSSIRLPDGTLKEVGEYSIDIELHPEVVQNIKVVISAKEEN